MRQAFDPADGVFDAYPYLADDFVGGRRVPGHLAPTRFFAGLVGLGTRYPVALEAGVLEHHGAGGYGQAAPIRQLFVVHAARCRGSQVDHLPLVAGEQQVLLAMGLLLAAVVVFSVLLVLGPTDGPLGSIEQEQAQFGHLFQEPSEISGPPGGQDQLPA